MFNYDNDMAENQNMNTMETMEGTDTMESKENMTATETVATAETMEGTDTMESKENMTATETVAAAETTEGTDTMESKENVTAIPTYTPKNEMNGLTVRQRLVPVEEQSVEIDWKAIKVQTFQTDIDALMPPDEVSIKEEYQTGLDEVVKRNSLTALHNMGNIKGVLGDQLYARIVVDEDGNNTYEYCQLINGYATPKLSIDQAFLLRLASAKFNFENVKPYERRYVCNKLIDIENQFLSTWNGTDYPADVLDVMNVLYHAKKLLPIYYVEPIDKARDLYERIKSILFEVGGCYFERQAYYAFIPQYFDEVAKKLNMPEKKLLRELSNLNLLYRQPSSVGYQAKIRIMDTTAWMICIYKLEFFDELEKRKEELGTTLNPAV